MLTSPETHLQCQHKALSRGTAATCQQPAGATSCQSAWMPNAYQDSSDASCKAVCSRTAAACQQPVRPAACQDCLLPAKTWPLPATNILAKGCQLLDGGLRNLPHCHRA